MDEQDLQIQQFRETLRKLIAKEEVQIEEMQSLVNILNKAIQENDECIIDVE